VIPAIDLRHGDVVRLYQGDYAQQTTFDISPQNLLAKYADAGAEWLHLVDLDAAKDGGEANLATITRLASAKRMKIQAGGGVRSRADVDTRLEAGIDRVVIGSLAVRETGTVANWLRELGPEKICLALDVRVDEQGVARPALAGWIGTSEQTLDDVLAPLVDAGARHLLCTDIGRDGTLTGPNRDLYAQITQRWPQCAVQASGGVGSLDDIRALRDLPLAGVIVGRALLEGRFSIEEALACWQDV
jgi:phosphoribosylformimino-5-aminoimidazole carboxamide ribotide isomerase